MALIFVDTEFTDFMDCHMISIGLSLRGPDGQEKTFYAEISDFPKKFASEWVKENVLPLLDGGAAQMPFTQASARLGSFIEELGGEEGEHQIAVDYSGDWELLVDMLDGSEWPKNLSRAGLNVFGLFGACAEEGGGADFSRAEELAASIKRDWDFGLDDWFGQPGAKRHHALWDVRGNRDSFERAVKKLDKKTGVGMGYVQRLAEESQSRSKARLEKEKKEKSKAPAPHGEAHAKNKAG